jgi:hypothetical protein
MEWMAVALGLVLVTATLFLQRPRGAPAPGYSDLEPWTQRRERVLLEVARVDERLEQGQGLSRRERESLRERRRALLAQIRGAG